MAEGVNDMAAFLGRSLDLLGFENDISSTGLGVCASVSDTLTLDFSSLFIGDGRISSPFICGGRVSLNLGNALAIELSGTPRFRGGGGEMLSSDWGRYAVAV